MVWEVDLRRVMEMNMIKTYEYEISQELIEMF